MRLRLSGLWRHRDFVNLWVAEGISAVGSQVSLLALPLIAAVTLDASPFEVGALAAAGQAPLLLLGLFAGAWIDRRHRRPIMIVADVGRAIVLLSIPLAAGFDRLSMPLLYVTAFLAGTLTVVFNISYLAYIPALVSDADLLEANGKLEATGSIAQVSGPGLGGLLIGLVTAPFAMLVDAASFLASALFLARIKTPEPAPSSAVDRAGVVEEIRDGLKYVTRNPVLRALVCCDATVSFFGLAFLAVYILYMADDLDLGSTSIGFVFAMGGVGAFFGALIASPLSRRLGTGRALIVSQLGFGLTGLLVPVAVLVPRIALPLIVASEFLQWMMLLAYIVNALSLRQLLTPPEIRGRANATFATVARGMQPLGSLAGGWMGGKIGLPWTLVLGELGILAATGWLIASPLRSRRTETFEVAEQSELSSIAA